jgi:hypothetical protein
LRELDEFENLPTALAWILIKNGEDARGFIASSTSVSSLPRCLPSALGGRYAGAGSSLLSASLWRLFLGPSWCSRPALFRTARTATKVPRRRLPNHPTTRYASFCSISFYSLVLISCFIYCPQHPQHPCYGLREQLEVKFRHHGHQGVEVQCTRLIH